MDVVEHVLSLNFLRRVSQDPVHLRTDEIDDPLGIGQGDDFRHVVHDGAAFLFGGRNGGLNSFSLANVAVSAQYRSSPPTIAQAEAYKECKLPVGSVEARSLHASPTAPR